MFKKKENRFITRGVQSEVPDNLKLFCWRVIDMTEAKGEIELDYFQVFEFKKNLTERKLIVIHRQEQPFYEKEYQLALMEHYQDLSVEKVWVIDDGVNQTMLLPDEY